MTEDQKLTETANSFRFFSESLGPDDIYKSILLEVLFAELMGVKIGSEHNQNLDLSRQAGQQRCENSGNNERENSDSN